MQSTSIPSGIKPRKIIPITPYSTKGKYRNIKSFILIVAYLVYFSMPWLTWHGAKRIGQPILIDLHTLQVKLFDVVIFPHDLIIIVGILTLPVLVLCISASLYGRMFCGFFCFQTLWTDAFRSIERFFQGEAQARLRLRKEPWTLIKFTKIGMTHFAWLSLSFATALTFTLYFWDANILFAKIFDGSAPIAAYTAVIALTATTYVAAGLAREQVCLVACPYGKFQAAVQDSETLTVRYDQARGERVLGRIAPNIDLKPATKRSENGYGDCIDCNYCVNVCPTGVDIRKGFQIDCIACGLCVDACNSIMDSVKLSRGLIDFGREKITDTGKYHLKIRTIGYLSVLIIMTAYVIFTIINRTSFDASIQHERQPLYIQMSNGDIKNRYSVRITNKTTETAQYILQVEGVPFNAIEGHTTLSVPPGKTYTEIISIVLPEKKAVSTDLLKLNFQELAHPGSGRAFDLHFFSGVVAKT